MLRYSKNKLYVLACSFGPDSMALFDILENEGYRFVVAHVNYHKRSVSNYEEDSLRSYCKKRNIPFFLLDTTPLKVKGNFQSWARDIRYSFFSEVYKKVNADGIFIAHNLDDSIETYLMQKERHSQHDCFGLPRQTYVKGMRVLRPLLNIRKSQLLYYCQSHNVPFSIDESNLKDDYRRNQIRHAIVESLKEDEIKNILKEISLKNYQNKLLFKSFNKYYVCRCLKLQFVDDINASSILRIYMKKEIPSYQATSSFIEETIKAFKSKKNYITISLKDNFWLVKDYNLVKIINFNAFEDYIYTMVEPKKMNTPYLIIDFSKSLPPRIKKEDFPIYVRNIRENDMVTIGQNNKMVSHLYSEWKMPHDIRYIWPIFLNKDHKIIYIPRYDAKYIDNKNNMLIIKKLKY